MALTAFLACTLYGGWSVSDASKGRATLECPILLCGISVWHCTGTWYRWKHGWQHGSVAVAAGFDDGLAVLAFFVDVDDSQCDPDALDNLLNDHIDDNVGGVGETVQFEYTVSSLNPSSLTSDDYYR